MSRKLGFIGPGIVILGAVVAAVGIWWFVSNRPVAGDEIDRVWVDPDTALVVRAERGGERSFVEKVHGGKVVWQALVPLYAGRRGASGLAWSHDALTVRVTRNQRAELFALSMHDAAKIASIRLAPDHGAAVVTTSGPVTLTDHVRSYELVAGSDWHQLVALDLHRGVALWKQELGSAPIEAAGLDGNAVWVRQGTTTRRYDVKSGVAL